jgi:hypothetical protein
MAEVPVTLRNCQRMLAQVRTQLVIERHARALADGAQ